VKRILAVTLLLAAVSIFANQSASAAVKAGTTCKQAGQNLVSNGYLYTCKKSGGKSFWKKGAKVTIELDSPSANSTPSTGNKETVTVSQNNAALKAKSYLRSSAFSRSGLIKQLEYEGFSTEDATYGTDKQNANWNEQAALKAKSYLRSSAFSRSGLAAQLEYEGFSTSQALYGVSKTGL